MVTTMMTQTRSFSSKKLKNNIYFSTAFRGMAARISELSIAPFLSIQRYGLIELYFP